MALFPLCDHGLAPRKAVAHAVATIEDAESNPIQRADWLHLLSIFGMMAYPQLNVIGLIGREKMKDSVLWKEAMAEGEQRSKRADILAAIEERFSQPSADIAEQLAAIEDLDALAALFRLSL